MDISQVIPFLFWGGFILVALISWFVWDKRYRKGNSSTVPSGYTRTDEVFIDPIEGKKLRVYYNPTTGERFYRNE